MTIFNLGSINIDLFYQLSHFPAPGETLTALDHKRLLGGKGANQSIAAAKAGAEVVHIGATNPEDVWLKDEMQEAGVDVSHIQNSNLASGHAIVAVNADGENQIMLCPSANRDIDMQAATDVLQNAQNNDWALLQNETNGAQDFVAAVKERGLQLAYSAAPFEAEIVLDLLGQTQLLVVNEGEAAALQAALGKPLEEAGLAHLVVTRGGKGADYYGEAGAIHQPAFSVTAIDTTGAGDCFFGYFLAAVAQGLAVEDGMRRAAAAAAIQVTREGAAAAIPSRSEVDAFLAGQS